MIPFIEKIKKLLDTNTDKLDTNIDKLDNLINIAITEDNLAILSGSITIDASSNKTELLDYPTGYTMDNSIPIAFGINAVSSKGYNYIGQYNSSSADLLISSYNRRINLKSDGISMRIDNPTTNSSTVAYRLVLMQVEFGKVK